jgi:uncharacterized protein (DUF934 family)
MRLILRRRELLPDPWRYHGEEVEAGEPLIVPLAELLGAREHWWSWSGRLGVRLCPADRVEDLVADLPRLDLVAIGFPATGDGRGYSQARVLRGRLRFRGELRAAGAGVRPDQAFFLARAGFDALEPAAGTDPEGLRRALDRYDVAYQPGAALVELRQQRFFSADGPAA